MMKTWRVPPPWLVSFLETINNGAIISTPSGQLIHLNSPATTLFNCDREQAVGMRLVDFLRLTDLKTRSELENLLALVLNQVDSIALSDTILHGIAAQNPISKGQLCSVLFDANSKPADAVILTLTPNSNPRQSNQYGSAEETMQNLLQITRLYELSTEFVTTHTVKETAKQVAEKVVWATNAHSAVINLLDMTGQLTYTTDINEPSPRENGVTLTIFKSGEPIAVSDSAHEPDIMHPFLHKAGIRAFIGLPLKIDDQVIGVLCVRHRQPRRFSWREIETLLIFANQAAVAIQNARLYEKIKHQTINLERQIAERTFELQGLYDLAQALGQTTRPNDIVRLLLYHLDQIIDYDVAASVLFSEEQNSPLIIQAHRPLDPTAQEKLEELIRKTFEPFKTIALDQLSIEIRYLEYEPEVEQSLPIRQLGSVIKAVISVNHSLDGILLVATEAPNQFSAEQSNLLQTMADQAAETIGRLRTLLAAEHQRLETLVTHLPDGVILLDEGYRIVLINPQAQQFLAQLAPVVIDEKLISLANHEINKILIQTAAGLPLEVKSSTLPRHTFEMMAKSMAFGPEAGGWVLAIRDVTDDRATQKRIRQHEQMAAVGQLAAGIAHDFNNILTSIIGYSELLGAEPDIAPRIKEDLGRITKQGKRAAHLVSQILDFSRQSITEQRPIDLVSFLNETVKLLKRTISETIDITLDIELGSTSCIINADLAQLQQGLTNLAINARDAMPEGGQLQFRLRSLTVTNAQSTPTPEMAPGEWVALSISDNGIGISGEVLPHIFEPFFTTKEVGQGTGLGLAQVYGIVKQHGGDIDVKSEVDLGTNFTIYLPRISRHTQISEPLEMADNPLGNGETILLVEDDTEVLEVTKAMLTRLAYRVLAAGDGEEALKIFGQYGSEIDLVLTDLTMPRMGGVTLTEKLLLQRPTLKVVTMTGYPLKGNALELLSEGKVEWLHKPLTIKQLATLLNKLLTSPDGGQRR